MKVGDGNYSYSEGEKRIHVNMNDGGMKHDCIVMDTTAFKVCLGMNFIRENAGSISGLVFNLARLIFKSPHDGALSLVSMEGEAYSGQHMRLVKKEACSLVPELREEVLRDLGGPQPQVDLYANPKNHTETLYCTPLNSCYGYNWATLGLCWANPPWSHLKKMVTKCVLDGAKMLVITPDRGVVGEAREWRPLLDELTVARVPLPAVLLYVSDGAKHPLPAPRWGSIASLLDGGSCTIPFSDLDPQVVKFLHRVNRGLAVDDLRKRYAAGTPDLGEAMKPLRRSEVDDDEKNDMQQVAAVEEEPEKVEVQWEGPNGGEAISEDKHLVANSPLDEPHLAPKEDLTAEREGDHGYEADVNFLQLNSFPCIET